jgi:hypothetical protein
MENLKKKMDSWKMFNETQESTCANHIHIFLLPDILRKPVIKVF